MAGSAVGQHHVVEPTNFEAQARVDLRVYDLSGRLVRRIESARLEAGEQAFDWDGRTEAGPSATAGIYFVRLDVGSHRVVGKIVKAR